MPRTCIIINPRAGSADQLAELQTTLERIAPDGELVKTGSTGDATTFATHAARNGVEMIVAVGGDGTVNEVVNGIMRSRRREVVLGIIPLGTGNDLSRTLNIPLDPQDAIRTFIDRRVMTIDLIKMRWADNEIFGHNVAAGGFTGQIGEAMTDELKRRWGPLAYLRGAMGVLPDLTKYKTCIRHDGKPKQPVHAMNIIVANGRTAGGGIVVAPVADPGDGLLDVVIVRSGTALELAGVAARLVTGDYTTSDLVTHCRAKRVGVESIPGMWFNIDGELITNQPLVFSVVPGALRVIHGMM